MKKSVLTHIAEAVGLSNHATSQKPNKLGHLLRWFLPNGGTIVIVVVLIVTQSLWSTRFRSPAPTSTNTITYQGRLTDPDGIPLTGQFNMAFRLYDVQTGGTPLWEEDRTGGIRCSFRMDS